MAGQRTRSGKTPYSTLPDHCFWSKNHKGVPADQVDPVVQGGFTLTPEMAIATAGSCFAQHIARHLQQQGYNYLVAEDAHPMLHGSVAQEFGYGVFSARYGNLYTVRQLLQLMQRAMGEFQPVEDVWQVGDGFVDPFRPNIQPVPFDTMEEYNQARDEHFHAVLSIPYRADVFVFTLGLTEAWLSKEDGAVFPLCPGVAGGEFDQDRHVFHNFTVSEIVDDFIAFAKILRADNPEMKILLTVSPVPLIATAREDQTAITATCYSKSVLRIAAEELTQRISECYYFPSYEVITGAHSRGAYYAADLREVEKAGVEHVMSLFMKHYTDIEQESRIEQDEVAQEPEDEVAAALELICDEELIEKGL